MAEQNNTPRPIDVLRDFCGRRMGTEDYAREKTLSDQLAASSQELTKRRAGEIAAAAQKVAGKK